MEIDKNPNVGQKGRFYLTKNIWLPQEPIEKLNLKMSDMILRRMPKLPLGGDDALKLFPVLGELRKSHDKIKADLQYLLSHHEEIPALHEVHPRDLYVAGRAWRTFLLKIWGHEVKENTTAVPDTYAAICRIPGVHIITRDAKKRIDALRELVETESGGGFKLAMADLEHRVAQVLERTGGAFVEIEACQVQDRQRGIDAEPALHEFLGGLAQRVLGRTSLP